MLRRKKEYDDTLDIVDDIKYAARILAGGPDERGLKLLKASGFFLMVPDPTMISTSIGVSMVIAGKLLSKRRQKGLKDYLDDFIKDSTYLAHKLKSL